MKPRSLTLSSLIVAVPTACAAIGGIVVPRIYEGLFPKDFLPGALAQDVLTLAVCLLLAAASLRRRGPELKARVVALGLFGSIWYLYGIFTIERVYNQFYLLYAAAFAASFWAMLFEGTRVPWAEITVELSKGKRLASGIASIVIAAVFAALWIFALIPLMRERNRIEFLYSIYILDLCFVMPAFVITGIQTLRGGKAGTLLNPGIMIVGFFVIFPLGLNELAKPAAGMAMQAGPMIVSFAFSALMLALGLNHLGGLVIGSAAEGDRGPERRAPSGS